MQSGFVSTLCLVLLLLYILLTTNTKSPANGANIAMNFAKIQEQGYIPLYKRLKITDDLHEVCGFRTDYQFITKSKMKNIQKKSKGNE